uniref:hypothetical protein n=1 Tax=Wolbachia endosymbiont (group B) of Pilophorus perplexus TaxID=3066160 RepID=UPI00333EFF52
MKTNIDEPCAGNLQARFFRGSCSNKTQTRGVKLQLLPNNITNFSKRGEIFFILLMKQLRIGTKKVQKWLVATIFIAIKL